MFNYQCLSGEEDLQVNQACLANVLDVGITEQETQIKEIQENSLRELMELDLLMWGKVVGASVGSLGRVEQSESKTFETDLILPRDRVINNPGARRSLSHSNSTTTARSSNHERALLSLYVSDFNLPINIPGLEAIQNDIASRVYVQNENKNAIDVINSCDALISTTSFSR